MYGTGTKKMLLMLILQILKDYSDDEHHLTQQRIIKLLKSEYGMDCDRRSVKANVLSLIEMGYEIDMPDGYVLLSRDFEESELRLLIDSVLFSKTISKGQAKELIGKLEGFGTKYFESKVKHVDASAGLIRTNNKQVLYTVGILNDAMDAKKKVAFRYGAYDVDLKIHDKGDDYKVNPYQLVAANGFYYLLGNVDQYDNLIYFRVDKILNIEILEEKIKPKKFVKGLENGLDVPKHMAEHIFMLSGKCGIVKFKTKKYMLDVVVDWFGRDIAVSDEENDEVIIRVECNYKSMKYWAIQYGNKVEILEPQSLRDEIIRNLKAMIKKYSE